MKKHVSSNWKDHKQIIFVRSVMIQGVFWELTKSISFVFNPGGILGANMGGKTIFKHKHFDNNLNLNLS